MSALNDRFEDLDGDIIFLVDLVSRLGLSDDDLLFTGNFEKFKDIASYLNMVEHKNLFINRVIRNEHGDKLQKLWEYVKLAEQRDMTDEDLANTKEERARLFGDNESEEPEYLELTEREKDFNRKIKDIDDEMRIYER